jgi:hypothetical protein
MTAQNIVPYAQIATALSATGALARAVKSDQRHVTISATAPLSIPIAVFSTNHRHALLVPVHGVPLHDLRSAINEKGVAILMIILAVQGPLIQSTVSCPRDFDSRVPTSEVFAQRPVLPKRPP